MSSFLRLRLFASLPLQCSPPPCFYPVNHFSHLCPTFHVSFQDLFDIILDENQLEDACEHMADYLEAYWKCTHPASCSPANPLLEKLTAAQSATPDPLSSLHLQVLTKLRPVPAADMGEGQERRWWKQGRKEMKTRQTGTRLWSRLVVLEEVVTEKRKNEGWDRQGVTEKTRGQGEDVAERDRVHQKLWAVKFRT